MYDQLLGTVGPPPSAAFGHPSLKRLGYRYAPYERVPTLPFREGCAAREWWVRPHLEIDACHDVADLSASSHTMAHIGLSRRLIDRLSTVVVPIGTEAV